MDLAKRKASDEGRSLTSLIEEAVWEVVARKPALRGPRKMPRVSDAKGDAFPGIDITDGSALQEIYDLEYVERMKHFK
ncbi:MAG: hypothetical protein ACWA6X_08395 [Bauldia sp.]